MESCMVKGSGWKSHLTVVNGIAGGRAGDGIWISLSDPDQSQLFDHSGRNEIWREQFPLARTCDRASSESSTAQAA